MRLNCSNITWRKDLDNFENKWISWVTIQKMLTSTAYTDVVRSSLSTSSSGGKRRAMARRTLRPRLNLSNSDGSWPSNESETALRVDPIRGIAKDVLLKLARELLRDAPVAGLLILLQPLPLPLLAPLSTNPLSVPVALLCTLPSGPLVAILCFMKIFKEQCQSTVLHWITWSRTWDRLWKKR